MKKLIVSLVLISSAFLNAQDKQAYQLFNQKGKKVNYKKLLDASSKTDVVLFGEYHNNPICHWLQLELTKDLALKKDLVLGAEMIEADNQAQLNDYLQGKINQKQLDSVARLWSNHTTDYKPLVDFAKYKKLSFIATNIPRRYASMVHKKGFESLAELSPEEKSWIAPQPISYDKDLPTYAKMMTMMGEHTSPNLPKAQASKDATMAHFIIKNLKNNSVFIHFNGTYHSDWYEGINWYLKKYKPELKIITIATVEQNQIKKLDQEHLNKADFILVIDEDMTKTY
ncbi:ChaN family lipoprotein [Flavobacterium sp.]|uniref:ChaN family lipoprotein n=1 Tax=Flavobacterium sp. TaxID=239 RepID=UPI00262F44DD|nr:ChaN family lipoprotein [Flavobacterium sp.]MDD3003681.1 ChaN family lipoprotein [Flavobacterium sp.]